MVHAMDHQAPCRLNARLIRSAVALSATSSSATSNLRGTETAKRCNLRGTAGPQVEHCRMQEHVAPSAPFLSSGLVTLPSSSAPATLLAVCDVPVLTERRVARKRHLRRIRHAFVFSQRAALPAGGPGARLQRQGRTWESRRGAPARAGAGWRGGRLSTLALLSAHASEDTLAKSYIAPSNAGRLARLPETGATRASLAAQICSERCTFEVAGGFAQQGWAALGCWGALAWH